MVLLDDIVEIAARTMTLRHHQKLEIPLFIPS